MKRISVLVTGVGGGGVGQQIIKSLKLSKSNYEIIGTDIFPISKGLMEVDYPYTVPRATEKNYIDCLTAIIKKHQVKVLFPGSEPELKVISEQREKISSMGIYLPINPNHVIKICLNKFDTNKFLKNNGFYYPKTFRISSIDCLKKVDFYPAIIKQNTGSSGSINVFIVQNISELISLSKYLFLTSSSPFIAQEYVGNANDEYTVGVLISNDGEIINSIAVKRMILSGLGNKTLIKNNTTNTKLGDYLAISTGITQGEIGKFPEVTKQCEKIAIKMGCRSTVNIQCRLVENKIFVFEINPRFSGTTSFRAMVGYNEPDILIKKYVLNENVENYFEYQAGTIMRGFEEKKIRSEYIKDSKDLIQTT
ncbi:MAG: ATP-grasp domain-containing protein [Desulfobacteraceae bacterium]|nr:ATP-grasp domain-containing protein [Desulfobacteraceae bacterium]